MLLTGLPYGAVAQDTAEYMLGDVVATMVFFESDGTIDENLENWNPQLIQETKGRIVDGLQWWEDTLANFYAENYVDVDPIHSLNFIYDFQYADNPVATGYEPISRTSNEYVYWAADFLEEVGHLQTGNMSDDIRSFNNAQRLKYDADWAYTIFVANDHNDFDHRFAFGGSFQQAFAFSGGRHLVSPATRPASTFAHETGHIFYARDEYSGSGAHYTDKRGYYNSQNWNAYDNPDVNYVFQPSIMGAGSLEDVGTTVQIAWAAHTSSDSSFAMLGWQDSDGDGVFDVLDVPLTLSGTGYYDPQAEIYRFQGNSTVQALTNANSSGLRDDISINEVDRLVYSVDNGLTWQVKENYHAPEVDIDVWFTLSAGQDILLRTESVDPVTGAVVTTSAEFRGSVALPSVAAQPGIHGFVWDDRNSNGDWDHGERGVSGWTLQLVDAQGVPVQTAQYVDPDAYANEALLNNVLTGVNLSAVGWDIKDARVGALDSALLPPGDRLLGLVKSGFTDQWVSEWTSDSRVLRIDFDAPTTFVSIDAIAPSSGSYGRLEAYDSSGKLLGRRTTGALQLNESATLSIGTVDPQISYALVRATLNNAIMLDNLQVGPSDTVASGFFGAYALPYQPPGDYHVQAVPTADWDVGDPVSEVVDLTVTADGSLLWPVAADRPSDFSAVPSATASVWKNLAADVDVNDDWVLSPIDALLVIDSLNTLGNRQLSPDTDTPGVPFIDVTGDGFVSPRDALLVITALNAAAAGGGGQAAADSVVGWSPGIVFDGGGEGEVVQQHAEAQLPAANSNSDTEWRGLVLKTGVSTEQESGTASASRARSRSLTWGRPSSAVSSLFAVLGESDDPFSGALLQPVSRSCGPWRGGRDSDTDALAVRFEFPMADSKETTMASPDGQPGIGISAQFDEVLSLIAAERQKQPLLAVLLPEDLSEPAPIEDPAG